MNTFLSFKDYVFPSANHLLVDIRSLSSFQHGAIPHAVHLPFPLRPNARQRFNRRGSTPLSPTSFFENYAAILQQVKQLQVTHQQLVFYCEDGEWKSPLALTFLKKEIPNCTLLQKGYAGFIKDLSSFFSEDRNYYLLLGKTGSGKTKVLRALEESGKAVLDLEMMAVHRGSVFGNLNKKVQPSSPQFHNRLLDSILTHKTANPIFVEQKGKGIGRCTIPTELLIQFSKAKKIRLDTPKEQRIQNILTNYQKADPSFISSALHKLKKRLNPEVYFQCQQAVLENDPQRLVEHLVDYYDGLANYQSPTEEMDFIVDCTGLSVVEIANRIREGLMD